MHEENYSRDKIDSNARIHLKHLLVDSSETVAVKNGELQLETWQDLVLFWTPVCRVGRPRTRKLQVIIFEQ